MEPLLLNKWILDSPCFFIPVAFKSKSGVVVPDDQSLGHVPLALALGEIWEISYVAWGASLIGDWEFPS